MRWETEPKPFGFVDIEGKPKKSEYIKFDEFKDLTGKLVLDLKVISDYLFVGSGNYDFQYVKEAKQNLVYYSFSRMNNRLVIPGSSIKGAVRNMLEAISNSCLSQEGKAEKKFVIKTHMPCKDLDKLCPACRVFGKTGYKGRVSFSDALPIESIKTKIVKIAELFGPKPNYEKLARKFYQHKKFVYSKDLSPERNYRFVEAVPKGKTFQTILSFENLREEEVSLLLYSMGIDQDYKIKIGGAKSRCFGAVEFTPTEIMLMDENFQISRETGVALINRIQKIMSHKDLIVFELLEQYKAEVNKFDEICPRGAY
jgi:CRISPR type III-B/RAMP module RAMP protein Cmr6